jgi:hypothetical protein
VEIDCWRRLLGGKGMQMNREWHEGQTMPKGATEQQRMDRRREHAQAFGCRPIPAGLLGKLSEAERRKVKDGRVKEKQ